jgi:hypothetical protein
VDDHQLAALGLGAVADDGIDILQPAGCGDGFGQDGSPFGYVMRLLSSSEIIELVLGN